MKLNYKKLLKKSKFILAPMDEITNLPFRELCEKYGSSWTISELTSADALIRNKVSYFRYQKGNLKNNIVQIFGNNQEVMAKASNYLEKEVDKEEIGEIDGIDINFGCPSPRLIKNGMGSKLLEKPKEIEKIVEKVVKNTSLPVSCKIRIGFKKPNYLKISKILENCNIDLISVHGRLTIQGYSGKADWNSIYEIKKNLKIPVIGNGDVKNKLDLPKLKKVDGLMIGRSAIGNPLIFDKFKKAFKKEKVDNEDFEIKDKEKQKKLLLNYIKRLKELQNNKIDLKIIKTQTIQFLKNFNGSKNLRINIIKSNNYKEILKMIKNF